MRAGVRYDIHQSQVVGNVLDTPRQPMAVTADKAYDREKSTSSDQRLKKMIPELGQCPMITCMTAPRQRHRYEYRACRRQRHRIHGQRFHHERQIGGTIEGDPAAHRACGALDKPADKAAARL